MKGKAKSWREHKIHKLLVWESRNWQRPHVLIHEWQYGSLFCLAFHSIQINDFCINLVRKHILIRYNQTTPVWVVSILCLSNGFSFPKKKLLTVGTLTRAQSLGPGTWQNGPNGPNGPNIKAILKAIHGNSESDGLYYCTDGTGQNVGISQ